MWMMESGDSLLKMMLFFDEDLARRTSQQGCRCGGVLNVANYGRSPRGLPPVAAEDLRSRTSIRYSFCCTTCRKRTTPPSTRFHGRSWYVAPARLLASVMDKGSRHATQQLQRSLGISARTIARWRHWWNATFRTSATWTMLLGRLRPGAHEGHLPDSLIVHGFGSRPRQEHRFATLLQLLAPHLDGARLLRDAWRRPRPEHVAQSLTT